MKVKQPYEAAVQVPALNGKWVQPGEVVAIPDGELASFLEAGWIPADDRTKSAGRVLLDEGTISKLAVVSGKAVTYVLRGASTSSDEGEGAVPVTEEGAQG